MHIGLTEEETAELLRLLNDTIDADRFPLSPRIQTLRVIRAKLKPGPGREPVPPPKVYAPPRTGRYKRR